MLASAGCPARVDSDLVERGALVELVHFTSLIHDDVVDRAEVRRGVPAVHASVGSEVAVLLGLELLGVCGRIADSIDEGAMVAVAQASTALAAGQIDDLDRAFNLELTDEQYVRTVQRKTSSLFELAARLGVRSSSERDVGSLLSWVDAYGLAFQVADDCLDISRLESGKPRGTDLVLGVFGLPVIMALRRMDDERSRELKALLLAPRRQDLDPFRIASLVHELGGLRDAHAFGARYLIAARTACRGMHNASAARLLRDLTAGVERVVQWHE